MARQTGNVVMIPKAIILLDSSIFSVSSQTSLTFHATQENINISEAQQMSVDK